MAPCPPFCCIQNQKLKSKTTLSYFAFLVLKTRKHNSVFKNSFVKQVYQTAFLVFNFLKNKNSF